MALVALAERIQPLFRKVDMLGRWGGEKFVVIMPQALFEETMSKAAELCAYVNATPLINNHTITVSCGVTTATVLDTTNTLLHRADEALYAAKHRGRNRVEGMIEKLQIRL